MGCGCGGGSGGGGGSGCGGGVGGIVPQREGAYCASAVSVQIHSLKALTRVYTPGLPGSAQPSPQETTPTRVNGPLEESLWKRGPPLSPWQESTPPSGTPAHTIVSAMSPL